MPKFCCECQRCHGKGVSRSTWYSHNPEIRQRHRRKTQAAERLRTPSESAAAQGGPSSNAASGSGVLIDPGRYPMEEEDLSGRSVQAARSESVCINLIIAQLSNSWKYIRRTTRVIWDTSRDVLPPQVYPRPAHSHPSPVPHRHPPLPYLVLLLRLRTTDLIQIPKPPHAVLGETRHWRTTTRRLRSRRSSPLLILSRWSRKPHLRRSLAPKILPNSLTLRNTPLFPRMTLFSGFPFEIS